MLLAVFLLWLVLNGRVTLEICLFGAGISLALCFFSVKTMGYSLKWEKHLLLMLPRYLKYLFVLIAEMYKAAWATAKLILTPGLKPDPMIADFSPQFLNRRSEVALANSITLTPGTITVRLEHGELSVHCLTSDMRKGLEDSVFVSQLREMEAKG